MSSNKYSFLTYFYFSEYLLNLTFSENFFFQFKSSLVKISDQTSPSHETPHPLPLYCFMVGSLANEPMGQPSHQLGPHITADKMMDASCDDVCAVITAYGAGEKIYQNGLPKNKEFKSKPYPQDVITN